MKKIEALAFVLGVGISIGWGYLFSGKIDYFYSMGEQASTSEIWAMLTQYLNLAVVKITTILVMVVVTLLIAYLIGEYKKRKEEALIISTALLVISSLIVSVV